MNNDRQSRITKLVRAHHDAMAAAQLADRVEAACKTVVVVEHQAVSTPYNTHDIWKLVTPWEAIPDFTISNDGSQPMIEVWVRFCLSQVTLPNIILFTVSEGPASWMKLELKEGVTSVLELWQLASRSDCIFCAVDGEWVVVFTSDEHTYGATIYSGEKLRANSFQ